MFDLGWRRGETSVQLLTDTVDARIGRAWDHGKLSVGARVAAAAAGLWITPWTNGAPDPSRAQLAGYAGPDLRLERWGPHGTYAAVEGFGRYCWFVPLAGSVLDVADTPWGHAGLVLGVWDPHGRTAQLAGGVDAITGRVAPRVTFEATLHPESTVAPFAELRAGWATNQDDVLATRLGGLTPYHVPLAGAAWAEFWVEDYVASRLGLEVHAGELTGYALVDTAAWDYPAASSLPDPPARQAAVGLGLGARWSHDGVFLDGVLGRSPGLPRQDEVSPWSAFVIAGTDWRPLGARSPRAD